MSFYPTFDYKVIYSRRRTISVTVSDGNEITVRCRTGTLRREIESFLLSKREWLARVTEHNSAILGRFGEVYAYKKVLVGGRLCDLVVGDRQGMSDGCVRVKKLSSLKDVYVKWLGGGFIDRAERISLSCCLRFSSLCFRSYTARWGCCDGQNNISFNYKLLMLPEELQDYVILHELCQTVHHNHSKAFHGLLKLLLPDCAAREKKLKDYSFVSRLY